VASTMLGEAGYWLALHDPKKADPFYKEMTWKHWNQPTAVKARQLKWFPPEVKIWLSLDDLMRRPLPTATTP
jgi:hypothetical protein